jgi:hypothetical protein
MLKEKRNAAVFTICRNESFFLPLWISYYRQFFSDSDIYVLDHESTDGSTNQMPNRIIVKNTLTQDNDWLIKVTCDFQKKLLESYRNVLFVNVDEFVTAKPNLKKFIFKNNEKFVRCTGFEVIHMENELPYDKNKKVLEQRSFWYKNSVYNKPLLGQSSIEWTGGWHNAKNTSVFPNPEIILIHLHRMDFSMCLARHKKTSEEPIFKPDLEDKKWGWHHFVHENEDFAKWFYCIDASKELNAEKSLKIFQEEKLNSFDELYKKAMKLVELIPFENKVI